MRKSKKWTVIRKLSVGAYTVKEAAEMLNLSKRRIYQLQNELITSEEVSHIHGNSGKLPVNFRIDDELKAKIIALKRSNLYRESNFSDFHKFLIKKEKIKISYTSLVSVLKEAEITSPKGHKSFRRNFRWGKRRSHLGRLLHISSNSYDWLKNNNPCTLHMTIDDASGIITGLFFCKTECLVGYTEVLKQTLTNYGYPEKISPLKDGILHISSIDSTEKTDIKTEFGKLIKEEYLIDITTMRTHIKKCHDRLYTVLHEELSNRLKFNNIITIEQANEKINHYIKSFNAKFQVKPKSKESKFYRLESDDLEKLLLMRYERTSEMAGCCQWNFV